jgi:hypothetical protein
MHDAATATLRGRDRFRQAGNTLRPTTIALERTQS